MTSLPEWDGQPLAQTGSFSKCFSPGLRLGWFATNVPELVTKSLRIKAQQDFGSANLSQWIAGYAMTHGLFEPFVADLRKYYGAKAHVFDEALKAGGLPARGWKWEMPEGGLLLWLRGPEGMDTRADSDFCKACLDANVLYVPGDICYVDPATAPRGNVRLAIGVPSTDDLREAARRFCSAAASM